MKSGVYDQNDSDRGPEGALVFLGAKLKKVQKPSSFVESFSKQATTNGFKIDKIPAGDGGGKAVCAYQSAGQKVAICAWATKDSMGELVPTVPGYDSKQLSKIMLDMRPDVEKTDVARPSPTEPQPPASTQRCPMTRSRPVPEVRSSTMSSATLLASGGMAKRSNASPV